jgi:hypothetical protein
MPRYESSYSCCSPSCPPNTWREPGLCPYCSKPLEHKLVVHSTAPQLTDGHVTWASAPTTGDLCADGSSGDRELEQKVLSALSTAYALWKNRQKKYGPQNIAFTGAQGCFVRSLDKLSRLRGVYLENRPDMPDESIEDSWLDLLNYALMGYMCHKKEWPNGISNAK